MGIGRMIHFIRHYPSLPRPCRVNNMLLNQTEGGFHEQL